MVLEEALQITDFIFRFSADHLSSDLILRHVSVESLHGNREQSDRERALENFKTGTFRQVFVAFEGYKAWAWLSDSSFSQRPLVRSVLSSQIPKLHSLEL